eukprot:3917231-Pleurochrysis_carterae.AAC.3
MPDVRVDSLMLGCTLLASASVCDHLGAVTEQHASLQSAENSCPQVDTRISTAERRPRLKDRLMSHSA